MRSFGGLVQPISRGLGLAVVARPLASPLLRSPSLFQPVNVNTIAIRSFATTGRSKKGSKARKASKNKVVDEDKLKRTREYRQEYYKRNRQRLLERNKTNRATKNALAKQGIYTAGKKGRPAKKRADVDLDDDTLTPEELQQEIERHEQAHADWLAEMEENRRELMRMYEEEDDDEDAGVALLDEEPTGPLKVADVVKVLRAHNAQDVLVLDLRAKTDLCDYKVIVTGSSAAQMRLLTDAVFKAFKRHKEWHAMPKVEGRNNPDWVLIDAMSVMVHIFSEETRRKYNLEALWGLRPSAEELATTCDYDWETDLFPEYSEQLFDDEPEEE